MERNGKKWKEMERNGKKRAYSVVGYHIGLMSR
jgi:hypothetical protein